jgi:anti-sigma regulatory factor (Ser/Thr protein kinase)
MTTYRRTFAGRPEEIRRARDWTRATLNGHSHAEDAALIVSELATNALLHTASGTKEGTFHVSLTANGKGITVAVTDHGTAETAPAISHPADPGTHGRGLDLVAAFVQYLEVAGDENGRTITAHIASRPAAAERPSVRHR